jgi:exosome complex RNA-binding protein Rrp4
MLSGGWMSLTLLDQEKCRIALGHKGSVYVRREKKRSAVYMDVF